MRAFIVSFLVAVSLPAAAQQREDDLSRAHAHFRAGEALLRARLYDRAIAEYQASYALVMRPLLIFNLGQAYRARGETTGSADDLRMALDCYERYLEADARGKGAAEARSHIATLRRSLPPAPPPPPEPPPPPPPPPPVSEPSLPEPLVIEPSPPVAPPPPAPARGRSPWRVAGLVVGGAGVALLGGSAFFALRARAASDELAAIAPGDAWDAEAVRRGQAAQRNAWICLAGGGAAVAAGAVMTFVLGRAPRVMVTPEPAGLVLSGRF